MNTDATRIRTLKQIDRDLMTARELVRAALATKAQTIATVAIATRLDAAREALKALGA